MFLTWRLLESNSGPRAAGETVAGSPYAITQGTLAANANYTVSSTGSAMLKAVTA